MRAHAAAIVLAAFGCTPLADPNERLDAGGTSDASSDAPLDAGADAIAVDAGPDCEPDPGAPCPPLCMRERRTLGDVVRGLGYLLAEDVTLGCDVLWEMRGHVYVDPGVTVTIAPGTVIDAQRNASLIVSNGARLDAQGTAELPITVQAASDTPWGGVLLFGDARVVVEETRIYDPDDDDNVFEDQARITYGGTDDAHDCGAVRYLRLVDGGRESRFLASAADVNPLLLAGCGTDTQVDHVQIHRPFGDAFGLYGGAVAVRHLIASEVGVGQAYNWNHGYEGTAQFLIAHLTSLNDESGFEGRLGYGIRDQRPSIANATLIGVRRTDAEAIYLTSAAGVRAHDLLIEGFADVLHVFDGTLELGWWPDSQLTIATTRANPHTEVFAREARAGEVVDPPRLGNTLGATGLNRSQVLVDDLVNPDFVPRGDAARTGAATSLPAGLEVTGYLGAVDPDGEDWTQGWTVY